MLINQLMLIVVKLWCERRRRHVRRDAEVDHLGLWRRQRQIQESERPAQLVLESLPLNFIRDIHYLNDLLLYNFSCLCLHLQLTLVPHSGMTSTIPRQLLVEQRQKEPRHPLRPLHCNCSSRPRRRSMKFTLRLESSTSNLLCIFAIFSCNLCGIIFVTGRRLCHIFIEVLKRSSRERHRGCYKWQRQSRGLLKKGKKYQGIQSCCHPA